MPEPQPYIMVNPFIELNGEEVHCLASHLELAPDINIVETTTFCGVQEFPGSEKWYFRLTMYQSFDDDGADQILQGCLAVGGPVAYRVAPYRERAIGANNPIFSGEVVPRKYPIISGDAGEASEIELEWTMTAEPDRAETGTITTGSGTTPAGGVVPAGAGSGGGPSMAYQVA
ncbi:MAG: hypothetical protein J2P17_09435 [Mycobacterium sp.]|nr:hypothetical protein [Mycobacterium sp.]